MQTNSLSKKEILFLGTMLAMALPFIWAGVVLTLRRLRATLLPAWLIMFFFAPFINLVFFLLLSVLPSRQQELLSKPPRTSRNKVLFDRLIPDHPIGSAAMSLLLCIPFGIVTILFSTLALSKYGWGLFVAQPFCLGLASVLLYGYRRPRSLRSCLFVSNISMILLGIALVAFAIEGVICVAMAAPIGLILASIGGAVGYVIQRRPWSKAEVPSMLLVLVAIVPMLMGAEWVSPPNPTLFEVRSAVEVTAPPEKVWHHVISFPELPEPKEWLFRAGLSYPMRAKIAGKGVGATRYCVFSTGAFIEPIKVWDEPRLLRFGVVHSPPPMQEWTPYKEIHPPHLEGFLVSQQGQFLLIPLPDGRTRLEGTTWYRHNMWPAAYWRVWSDFIIHRIHLRVLRHVKELAERDGSWGGNHPIKEEVKK